MDPYETVTPAQRRRSRAAQQRSLADSTTSMIIMKRFGRPTVTVTVPAAAPTHQCTGAAATSRRFRDRNVAENAKS